MPRSAVVRLPCTPPGLLSRLVFESVFATSIADWTHGRWTMHDIQYRENAAKPPFRISGCVQFPSKMSNFAIICCGPDVLDRRASVQPRH